MSEAQKQARILVVDDDPTARLIAGRALGRDGHAIEACADGASALEAFRREPPDLVILDVQMPGLDGYAVCEEIRRNPQGERIPVVMMTGLGDVSAVQSAYDAGATDFISKPIQWMVLCQRVRYLLRAKAMLEELDRNRSNLATAQSLARIGSFRIDFRSGEFESSAELKRIWETEAEPSLEDVVRLSERVHPEDRDGAQQALLRCIREQVPASWEHRRLRTLGDGVLNLQTRVQAVVDADHRVIGIEGTVQDITERVETEEQLRYLSSHDSLTGLLNRRVFEERLDVQVRRTLAEGSRSGVLFMDLDQFRRINDTFGHTAGDALLRQVARRIVDELRSAFEDAGRADPPLVARLVGDELAILVSGITRAQELAGLARRLLTRLSQPFTIEGRPVVVGAGIGIAVCPDDGDAAEVLLRNADAAVQHAKESGRNAIQFFAPAMNETAASRMSVEVRLREALSGDGLVLHYQPRVLIGSGKVAGFEALVRLRDPERGLVPPSEFVPVAEETGLIEPLTDWVIRAACRQAVSWGRMGLPDAPISTNVSVQLFRRPGLSQRVATILRDVGCPATALCIEITESALLHDAVAVSRELAELRELGVRIALDDFGTGYSSLSYLQKLPVDQLKIDRSFVEPIATDPQAARLTQAIISMGKALSLEVVAEGVEDGAQARLLEAWGCHELQGFFLSPPVEADEAERFWRQRIVG